MLKMLALSLILLLTLGVSHGCCGVEQVDTYQQSLPDDQECPTWFIPTKTANGTTRCECGSFSSEKVQCDQGSNITHLLLGNCMTYNEEPSTTVVGPCPYNSHRASDMQQVYMKLPKNVSKLNAFMCGGLNRTGQLCSHCKEGLGIPVFSYTLHCVQCMDSHYGWLLYSFLALFPTTVFFIIVIMLQIRVTSAQMNAFIFVCQFLTSVMNISPYTLLDAISSKLFRALALIFTTLYGIWNVDFFRFLIPPFCASNQLGPIHVIALEYIVAFYPLFLTAVTYVCIQLHTRDCRVIVCLWRPFGRCLGCFRETWDPTKSLVHAFSSFLLLSYSKILFVSLQLLVHVRLYEPTGEQVGTMVYYDASLVYFGSTHLPFALLAIFVLCVFIVLPALVLLLYPTRAFQRCLGCCSVRWHALHAFADTFQGYYKNGTEGARDYRYFAGLYLIVRIIFLLGTANFLGAYGWLIGILGPTTVSFLFALLRPYKNNWFNVWDSVVFLLIAFAEISIMYNKYVASIPLVYLGGIVITIPLVYISIYTVYKLFSRTNIIQRCRYFINKQRSITSLEADRLVNPEEYQQLLPSVGSESSSHQEAQTYPACGNSLQDYDSH